jgi:hypothetical protein
MDYMKKLKIYINNQDNLDLFEKKVTKNETSFVIENVIFITYKSYISQDNLIYDEYTVKYKTMDIDLSLEQRKTIFRFASEKYQQLVKKEINDIFV